MILRERKRDGHQFLGCDQFPSCRYTITTKRKYKKDYRKEYELAYGEPIPDDMEIHHINGKSITREDNDKGNLLMVTSKEHKRIHRLARKMWKERGWDLETTTRNLMANKGRLTDTVSDSIIINDEGMSRFMETFQNDKDVRKEEKRKNRERWQRIGDE